MKKPDLVETTFAEYTITGVVGEGGSGIVYSAVDDQGLSYAVKILDPAKATTEKRKRFENEYRFCNKNVHPNIIQVGDHGLTSDGAPFFVMPLYDGSLRNLIGVLDADQSLVILSKIMDGLDAAHKLGVIHRDLKPENILIRNGGDELVLADFGIANFEEEDRYTAVETKDATRLANFQYAAPEQRIRGKDVDHRADLYSLGLIANELFTQEIPYGVNFKRIESVATELSYVDKLIEKLLEQSPENRFLSVEVLKQEMIARGAEHVRLQKISELEKTVIPTSDIDDAIILDPMRIVEVDWENGNLTITLNHNVTPDWAWAFSNMGNFSSLLDAHPRAFKLSANRAMVSIEANFVQQVIDHFKVWLPKIAQVYEDKLRQDLQAQERAERRRLEERIRKEKERADVMKKLEF